jgi:hypothetical protein
VRTIVERHRGFNVPPSSTPGCQLPAANGTDSIGKVHRWRGVEAKNWEVGVDMYGRIEVVNLD